jgi:site-specific recombinase XerD
VASVERDRQQVLLKVRAGAEGGKHRNVPIPAARAAVDAYLDDRVRLYGATAERSRLFVQHDGSPPTKQLVDRARCDASREPPGSPPDGAMAHALRHAYEMDLAMRGVPLSVIQQLLGHDDPRPTSMCTAAHAEDLSAALADAGAL